MKQLLLLFPNAPKKSENSRGNTHRQSKQPLEINGKKLLWGSQTVFERDG